jgi:hypothetical protein
MEIKEIELINTLWCASEHPKNNPKEYNVLENNSPEHALVRKNHLIQLLTIIYDYIHEPNNIDYFKSHKDDSLDAFNKYVKSRVIDYYPYEEEVLSENYVIDNVKESEFKIWLLNLFTISSKRVSWQPKLDLNEFSDSQDLKANSDKILDIRLKRLHLLSKICCFLDEIQTKDYQAANVIILSEKGEITGYIDKLAYGHKHILSAYLGQHIVRMFPFKDFNHFKSTALLENLYPKTVYEHFTPMSFFRDLIWVKPQTTTSNLFDESSKPYNERQWLSILWYAFRTIYITEKQDKEYLNKGYKSRRLFSTYDKLELQIHNKTCWDYFHSLESLKRQL